MPQGKMATSKIKVGLKHKVIETTTNANGEVRIDNQISGTFVTAYVTQTTQDLAIISEITTYKESAIYVIALIADNRNPFASKAVKVHLFYL